MLLFVDWTCICFRQDDSYTFPSTPTSHPKRKRRDWHKARQHSQANNFSNPQGSFDSGGCGTRRDGIGYKRQVNTLILNLHWKALSQWGQSLSERTREGPSAGLRVPGPPDCVREAAGRGENFPRPKWAGGTRDRASRAASGERERGAGERGARSGERGGAGAGGARGAEEEARNRAALVL